MTLGAHRAIDVILNEVKDLLWLFSY